MPVSAPAPGPRLASLFSGDGEMAARMRAHDWTATPLGAPETWPESLCTAVQILLTSRFAMWIGWGPELVFLYNDAYRRDTIGAKHPHALGRPAAEVWAEVWPDLAPRVAAVMDRGETTWDEALLLFLERNGYREEAYFTFSYSPLPDGDVGVGGLLCVVAEETERVIAARRTALLREVTQHTAGAETPEAALAAAAAALATDGRDFPFAAFYLAEENGTLRRVAVTGLDADHPAAGPLLVPPPLGNGAPDPSADPLVHARTAREPIVFAVPPGVPPGPSGSVPTRAVAVPLPRRGGGVAGVMVAALTPFRPYNTRFEGLIGLVAGAVATAVGSAEGLAALARARDETAQAAARTARLQAVTAALAPALTAEAVAEAVLEHGLPAVGATAGGLSLRRGDALTSVRTAGYTTEATAAWPAIPLDAPVPLADAVRTGAAVWVGTPGDLAARYPAIAEPHGRTGYRALAALPLGMGEGPALGVISLSFAAEQPFDDATRALGDALATQAALALDRVRLFEAERGSRDQALFRARLADALRPLADPAAVQYEAARALGEHLEADRVGYAEAQPDGETVVVTRNYTAGGAAGIEGPHRVVDFGSALLAEFEAGRTVVRPDIAADLTITAGEKAAHAALALGATLYVPLVKDGRFVALLFVHHASAHAWTAGEVALAEETAERAWAAVKQARAEAALRESEERYRTLFTSIDEGFALVEILHDEAGRAIDYRFLDVNPGFSEMTGLRAAAAGHTARELVPGLEDEWVETYARVAETGEAARFELGSEAMGRWFNVYAAPSGPPERRAVAIVFTDVTERARAEAALRESEVRGRLALDAAALGLWTWDPATDEGFQDARTHEILGLAADDAITMTEAYARVVHPDDLAAVVAAVGAASDPTSDGRLDVAFRVPRPDGADRWVRTTARMRFAGEGASRRPAQMTGTIEDVTAQWAAEAVLRQREETFRTMANVAPAMLWVTDPAGACTFLSDSWTAYTGQPASEGWGLGWTDMAHPDDRATAGETFLAASAAREPFAADFRLRRADGVYRWVVDAGRPWFGPDGAFLGFVGAVLDVHDRRAAEEALRLANETLEARVAERTADVRALSAALTLAEQRERERLSRVLHDDLQQVLFGLQLRTHAFGAVAPPALAAESAALGALASDALRTTRSLSVDLAPPVLRGEGLAEALRWLAVRAEQAYHVRVEAGRLDDVPGLGEDVRVLLFGVARELLLNVAKHAGTDQAKLSLVRERADGGAETLTLTVADQGRGFDPDATEAADLNTGTGLGLTSLRDRLAYRGGELRVESAPGRGAHVHAVLPLDLSDAGPDLPTAGRVSSVSGATL